MNKNKINFTDELFFEHISNLYLDLFNNDFVSIMDMSCFITGATKPLVKLFGVENENQLIGRKSVEIEVINLADIKQYDAMYFDALKHQNTSKHLELLPYSTGPSIHAVYKKPLINPFSNNTVGLLCRGEELQINGMLKVYLEIINRKYGLPKYIYSNHSIKLGTIQSEVLFTLLLGIRGNKEIASFINRLKGVCSYSAQTIKNAMDHLYSKFNAEGNVNLLIEKAVYFGFNNVFPPTMITKYGIFNIKI